MKYFADKSTKTIYGVEDNELKAIYSFINGLWEESTSFGATKEVLYKNASKLGKLVKFNVLTNAKKSVLD